MKSEIVEEDLVVRQEADSRVLDVVLDVVETSADEPSWMLLQYVIPDVINA